MIMDRIYGYGMTTTSGGNLSVKDQEGSIWITPGGIDKGELKPEQIVRVDRSGEWEGPLRPSLELPFHQAIYAARPDAGAVLHAHPPALVSFSITDQIPDTSILPNARNVCGEVGFAPYALPGSAGLAKNVSEVFERGHDTVIMENHGIVTIGESVFQSFQRFETLDFCARLIINGKFLGKVHPLSPDKLNLSRRSIRPLPEAPPGVPSRQEMELRKSMCTFIHRAYQQKLITSTEGTFSARMDEEHFVITPFGMDRKLIEPEDLVLIKKGRREKGKTPSRSVGLHQEIYKKYRHSNAIIIAHPPNTMAFGVSGTKIDTTAIPESYVFLRDIPLLPFGVQYEDDKTLAGVISDQVPIAMIENDCIIVSGKDLLNCFDRLEITEFIAESIISAKKLGTVHAMDHLRIQELKDAFLS